MGNVTLKSVAEAAGVSVSTVSNAYNKPDQLSAEVRQRVLETAKALGYAGPNPAARSLRSQRARAIGLVFTERLSYAFSDPYSVGMLAGLAEVAEQFQTGLLLIPLRPFDPERPGGGRGERRGHAGGRRRRRAGLLPRHRPPGPRDRRRARAADGRHGRQGPADGRARAHRRARCRPAGRRAHPPARPPQRRHHRRQQGRLARGSSRWTTWSTARCPSRGTATTASARGSVPTSAVHTVAPPGHNSVEAGRAAGAYLLDRQDRPTAIIAVSDVLALGVLDAMRQRGLTPGRDVSLVGFDDVPAAADAGPDDGAPAHRRARTDRRPHAPRPRLHRAPHRAPHRARRAVQHRTRHDADSRV